MVKTSVGCMIPHPDSLCREITQPSLHLLAERCTKYNSPWDKDAAADLSLRQLTCVVHSLLIRLVI